MCGLHLIGWNANMRFLSSAPVFLLELRLDCAPLLTTRGCPRLLRLDCLRCQWKAGTTVLNSCASAPSQNYLSAGRAISTRRQENSRLLSRPSPSRKSWYASSPQIMLLKADCERCGMRLKPG